MPQAAVSVADNPMYAELKLRRQKNLEFFKAKMPHIYEKFHKYGLNQYKLNLITETGELDLLLDGKSLYNNQAKAYAKQEVLDFTNVYSEGKSYATVRPPFPGEYHRPRFFSQRINNTVCKSPTTLDKFPGYYRLGNFYPMLVFLGCGLGLHIKEMIDHHDIQNILIYEYKVERFAASLYAVDWQDICEQFQPSKGRSIKIILMDMPGEHNRFACIWNELIKYCPHFPVCTLFYNHLRDRDNNQLLSKLNKDLHVFLNLWGYYDDEINQMNNGFHVFHRGAKKLPLPPEKNLTTPILVIGSGPSLDDRIDSIKQIRDQVIVLSCGTALKSLHHHGIVPDIHVDLESHLETYNVIQQINDPEYLKKVLLIGAAQLPPMVFELFKDSRIFFKDSTALGSLMASPEEIVRGVTPTCTNAGSAICLHERFENIFFFGMDFGFANPKKHHSEGTIYYADDAAEILKKATQYNEKSLLTIKSVNGDMIKTTSAYYAAKRRIEVDVMHYKSNKNNQIIYNCSDGSDIEHTEWLDSEKFLAKIAELEPEADKQADIDHLFNPEATIIDKRQIDSAKNTMETFLTEIKNSCMIFLNETPENNAYALSKICFKINNYLENTITKKYDLIYYFIRGAIWHYLYAGLSHAVSIQDSQQQSQWVEDWREGFTGFVQNIQKHYRSVIEKDFDINKDKRAWTPINEDLGDIELL